MRVFPPAVLACSALTLTAAYQHETSGEHNGTSSQEDVLLASTVNGNYAACKTPSPQLWLGATFSKETYKQINDWFKNKVMPRLQVHKDDQLTTVSSYDYSGSTGSNEFKSFASEVGAKTSSSLRWPHLDIASTISIHESSSLVTLGQTANVASFTTENDKLVNSLYCGLDGSTPITYLDAADKRQCGCCSGESCSCTGGELRDINGNCRCPPGATCQKPCEPGYHAEGTVCVRTCFWTPNNVGKVCDWASANSHVKLLADCSVTAPVPKDNYVNDKRTNKAGHTHDPLITIKTLKNGATTPVPYTSSWLDYATDPTTLENSVVFSQFGVYALSMVAEDYRGQASCSGCVAVVDKYPPHAIQECALDSDEATTEYSSAAHTELQALEASFAAFYAATNVENNGEEDAATLSNVRDDENEYKKREFFASGCSNLASLDTHCFDSNLISDLLDLAPATYDKVDGQLQCKRCCTKKKTLREIFYKYRCGEDPAVTQQTKHHGGTESCELNQCVNVPATTLVTASVTMTTTAKDRSDAVENGLGRASLLAQSGAATTSPTYIHDTVKCTEFDQGCEVKRTLSDLFARESNWGSDVQTAVGSRQASAYVTWQYALDINSWMDWDDSVELTFTAAETDVYVAAWTACGRVVQTQFRVVLHTHSDHPVCETFDELWIADAANPFNREAFTCTYPKSDFTVLTFSYDSLDGMPHEVGMVKGKYTDVKCYVKLADADPASASTAVQEVELALDVTSHTDTTSGQITLAKQLALELVRDPTTAKDTTVTLRCDFTFTYFGSEHGSDEDKCSTSFTITDCEAPEIERIGDHDVCDAGKCLDPASPGAYEPCGGAVFGVESDSATTLATSARSFGGMTGGCCEECGTPLTCSALDASVDGGVKRCEPAARPAVVALEADGVAVGATEYSMGVALVGVSAMVAAVAAMVVTRRRTERAKITTDEGYYALLE